MLNNLGQSREPMSYPSSFSDRPSSLHGDMKIRTHTGVKCSFYRFAAWNLASSAMWSMSEKRVGNSPSLQTPTPLPATKTVLGLYSMQVTLPIFPISESGRTRGKIRFSYNPTRIWSTQPKRAHTFLLPRSRSHRISQMAVWIFYETIHYLA